MRTRLLRFDGWIYGAAFASGDRFVVGRWPQSPLGSFADVMWARPDGGRVLVAASETVLRTVGDYYSFDELRQGDVQLDVSPTAVRVLAPPIEIELDLDPPGVMSWLLAVRPRVLRTIRPWIALEDLVLRPLVAPLISGDGIRARGRTRTGAREWYAIHAYRTACARATIDGVDLGPSVPARASGFGFSEFPPQPAAVRVTSLIEGYPSAGGPPP